MAKKIVVLDTNILIVLFRARKSFYNFYIQEGIDKAYITYPTYIEFLAGARLEDKRLSEKFLKQMDLLPFDEKSQTVGKKLAMQNRLIGKGATTDMFIASICISNSLPLVTSNTSDFNFIGLEVIKYTL